MPTPYGSRGGMAFGSEELRVLRRALALALNPSPASVEDVQDCLRLAEAVDEAVCERARLRAFLVADLARYRAALPGTATGYLALLEEVLGAGYSPVPDDLAALRALRGNPTASGLLDRCVTTTVPAARTRRLTALPGGLSDAAGKPAERPAGKPVAQPAEKPAQPAEKPAQPADKPGPVRRPEAPEPARRPIPTPGEVFPPKRKPAAPPAKPPQQRLVAAV